MDNLHIEGIKVNIPLHKVVLREETFLSGNYSTNYIGEIKPQDQLREADVDAKLIKTILGTEFKKLKERVI